MSGSMKQTWGKGLPTEYWETVFATAFVVGGGEGGRIQQRENLGHETVTKISDDSKETSGSGIALHSCPN